MKDSGVVKPMVIWSDQNGWSLDVEYPDEAPMYEKLKRHIGGFIEHVTVLYNGRRCSMWVHEEGRMQFDWRNEWATQIYFTNMRLQGKDPESPEVRLEGAHALADSLGIPHDAVYTMGSDGKPEGIYGPVVLVDGFQQEEQA